MKRTGLILLSLVFAASMWGCASHAEPQTTTLPPNAANESTAAPEEVTDPQTTVYFEEVTDPDVDVTIGLQPVPPQPGTFEGVEVPTAQLRIHTVDTSWQNAFNQENGCFALVSSVEELNDLAAEKLSAFSLDLTAYDEAFFAENRLVLIPRSSNSGSVTYQAMVNTDDGFAHIELDARMPEIGTMDMAQWLVLVTLPNGEYDDMTISVPVSGGITGRMGRDMHM